MNVQEFAKLYRFHLEQDLILIKVKNFPHTLWQYSRHLNNTMIILVAQKSSNYAGPLSSEYLQSYSWARAWC
jgi:hypothetical protein